MLGIESTLIQRGLQHMDGHLAALVCISTKPEPLYHLLAGDAAHVVSLIDYESPAHIGIYKAKDFAMSPYAMTEPEKLQSFEEDIGETSSRVAESSLIRRRYRPCI